VSKARIKIMPDRLKNQIAAGEVVERPASVVKELVENAMDAGATRIHVEVEEGGKKLIRVVDNGAGMARQEALLALERHATSKCGSIEDLRAIATFGFRGEALPSIASVSDFTLRTRPHTSDIGTEVRCVEGVERHVDDATLSPGTEIRVENLFTNVPARRKFLKKETTENRAIVDVLQRMALSDHSIHFELVCDGRTVLSAPAETDRMARVFAILGRKVCKDLYECYVEGRVSVAGFISRPDRKKRGTSGLFTFVNGRFVRDKVIIQAIANGYSTLLGRGDYPYAVLDIEVPAADLDVNVHPAKSEVRFQNSSEVFSAIARAVRLTIADAPWFSDGLGGEGTGDAGESGQEPRHAPPLPYPGESPPRFSEPPPSLPEFSRDNGLAATDSGISGPDSMPAPLASRYGFARVQYLGQFANCFLLGQSGDTLVLVDQHAAHERVMFDRLCKDFESSGISSQPLLVPQLIELEPALVAEVEVRRELLERLGFTLEPFGRGTLAVKAVPLMLKQRSPERAVRAILEELTRDEEITITTLFHKPISTMACHMAVRAGDPMKPDEAVALFQQMEEIDLAAYCPHGRPVVTYFTQTEVARWFNRT